jgi:hypothetical protein
MRAVFFACSCATLMRRQAMDASRVPTAVPLESLMQMTPYLYFRGACE